MSEEQLLVPWEAGLFAIYVAESKHNTADTVLMCSSYEIMKHVVELHNNQLRIRKNRKELLT